MSYCHLRQSKTLPHHLFLLTNFLILFSLRLLPYTILFLLFDVTILLYITIISSNDANSMNQWPGVAMEGTTSNSEQKQCPALVGVAINGLHQTVSKLPLRQTSGGATNSHRPSLPSSTATIGTEKIDDTPKGFLCLLFLSSFFHSRILILYWPPLLIGWFLLGGLKIGNTFEAHSCHNLPWPPSTIA